MTDARPIAQQSNPFHRHSVQQDRGAFSRFVRHVGPSPVPGKVEFYTEETRDHFARSYVQGNKKYFASLVQNPFKALFVGITAVGLGLCLSAFQRADKYVKHAFAAIALVYPVIKANRNFAEMAEAYTEVQQGNPTKGRHKFRKALEDSVYSLFHNFLKPLSIAIGIGTVLSLPKIMKTPRGVVEKSLLNPLLTKLRNTKPVDTYFRLLDKVTKPFGLDKFRPMAILERLTGTNGLLSSRASKLENKLFNKYPRLEEWIN